jgi:hypothetical protein
MPKRRRVDRSNDEVETVTFSMPEDTLDNTPSYSTTTPTPTTSFSPPLPLPEQVYSVSEWTIETNRVSTSNMLFSSKVEPVPSMSFNESDHDLHAHHNYYNVVDVSDFQPPDLLQSSRSTNTESTNTESSKSSKERLFVSFPLIVI